MSRGAFRGLRVFAGLGVALAAAGFAALPSISLSPTSLSLTAKTVGGMSTVTAQVQLTNPGSPSTLEWTTESTKPWLRVSPIYGTTQGETDLLTVTATTRQTEEWTTATSQANAPPGRENFTLAWTGKEMIVWGGTVGFDGAITNDGACYDPVSNTWTRTTSQVGAPSPRIAHSAVWTGSRMLVWGGRDNNFIYFNDGYLYDPRTDTWSGPISSAGAPSARVLHSAVWSGTEMIVWGGFDGGGTVNDGGRYNPSTDTWSPVDISGAPSARDDHFAVWTGTEMLIWGGEDNNGRLNTGRRYHPGPNTWGSDLSTVNAPTGRAGGASAWTGSEMIVWGGITNEEFISNAGGRYDPVTDTWQATTLVNSLSSRRSDAAIWAGGELIVWGGYSEPEGFMNSGKRYHPPIALAKGNTYFGSIVVSDPSASNSPQSVSVTLKVK
jgi:N-acetylneuraminic acid mutarotase